MYFTHGQSMKVGIYELRQSAIKLRRATDKTRSYIYETL